MKIVTKANGTVCTLSYWYDLCDTLCKAVVPKAIDSADTVLSV